MSVLARLVVVPVVGQAVLQVPAENLAQAVLRAPVGNLVPAGILALVVPRVPVENLAPMGIQDPAGTPACLVRRDYAVLHNGPYYPATHTLHNLRIPACFAYGYLHILRVISGTNTDPLDYPAAY